MSTETAGCKLLFCPKCDLVHFAIPAQDFPPALKFAPKCSNPAHEDRFPGDRPALEEIPPHVLSMLVSDEVVDE